VLVLLRSRTEVLERLLPWSLSLSGASSKSSHTLINVPIHFLPAKIYYGQKTSQPTVRYFADKFPMFFGSGASFPLPVVTFTYLQGAEATVKSTTYRKTTQTRALQDSHTAHLSLAVHTVTAVPAKTANKPPITIWTLMRV